MDGQHEKVGMPEYYQHMEAGKWEKIRNIKGQCTSRWQ